MEFGLYQHYKGKFYLVVDVARHAETLEDMVVYQALYGDLVSWVRSKTTFEEMVTVDGKKVPSFSYIGPIEEVGEHDDEDLELLMALDNEKDLNAAVALLKENEIDCVVQKDRLNPKPQHIKSDLFLKLFIDADDFESALVLLNGG